MLGEDRERQKMEGRITVVREKKESTGTETGKKERDTARKEQGKEERRVMLAGWPLSCSWSRPRGLCDSVVV